MILISQWFERAGHDECREANEKIFDECHYLDGVQKRWTYGEMVWVAKSKFPDKVCVIANTDIKFDETIRYLEDIPEKQMVALTRWDHESAPRMLGHSFAERFFSGTQDSWTFRATPIVPQPGILLGRIGCENAFLGECMRSGMGIFNPALDVKTWHVHPEGAGEEHTGGVSGVYVYPELTTLNSTSAVLYHDWPSSNFSARIRTTWEQ